MNGFGYSTLDSILLNIPSGAAQIMALWIAGYFLSFQLLDESLTPRYRYLASRFKGIRHFLALGGLLVAIIGAAMIYGLPTERKVARLMFVHISIIMFSRLSTNKMLQRILSPSWLQRKLRSASGPDPSKCCRSYKEEYYNFIRVRCVSPPRRNEYPDFLSDNRLGTVWAISSGPSCSSRTKIPDINQDSPPCLSVSVPRLYFSAHCTSSLLETIERQAFPSIILNLKF